MSNAISPAHLIAQARELAGVTRGRGRPNHTKHRRAVSTAYYAAYHALALRAAKQLTPNAGYERQSQVTRAVQHASVAAAGRWIVSTNAAGTKARPPSGTPPIVWRILTRPR